MRRKFHTKMPKRILALMLASLLTVTSVATLTDYASENEQVETQEKETQNAETAANTDAAAPEVAEAPENVNYESGNEEEEPSIPASTENVNQETETKELKISTSYTYTGLEQSCTDADASLYTVTGTAKATDAGNYEATLTLTADAKNAGYVWFTSSEDSITVNWEIKKAKLKATYKDETVTVSETPAYQVVATGFVNGESADTATDYTAPAVKVPSKLEAGKSYTLTPKNGSAKNYSFTYVPGILTVTEEKKEEGDTGILKPGTYQITANVYLPGELNTQLPGVTAYMTNPNNPAGVVPNNLPDGWTFDGTKAPTTPASNNATLVVKEDGSYIVEVDIVNPVFTLQKISSGSDVEVLSAVRDTETYKGNTGVSRNGRITKLYLKLKNTNGTYQFGDCTEFPTLLEKDWNVPMKMDVDFTSAKRTSSDTIITIPDTKKDDSSSKAEPTAAPTAEPTAEPTATPNTNNTTNTATAENTVTKLKPGTYTVTANIWFNREDSGLPMNPHITSSVFPPKDPVANNATLTVDANNHAYVTIPISIQSKVMTIRSISGLNITDMQKNSDGAITSITVDLGIMENPDAVITKTCTIDLWMGDLAMSISGFSKEHTWPATFQLNLNGVATEGGVGSADAIVGSGTLLTGVKTGDESPIALYVFLIAAALATSTVLAIRKKYNR